MKERHKILLSEFFPEVKDIRTNQKIQFNNLIEKTKNKNDVVLLYFTTQTDSAWNDIEFSLRLLEYNEVEYFSMPIRGIFNKVIKLLYLTHMSDAKRDELCRKDFLKISALFFSLGDDGQDVYKKSFDDFNTLGLDISEKIIAFPDMKSMLTKIFPNEVDTLYLLYSDLSELVHGNVLFNFRKSSYLTSGIDILGRFAFELIKVNDWHLNNGEPSEKVLEFLNKWKERFEEDSSNNLV